MPTNLSNTHAARLPTIYRVAIEFAQGPATYRGTLHERFPTNIRRGTLTTVMPTVYKGALGSVAPCVLPASCGARLPRLHRLPRKIFPTVLGVEVVSRPTSGVESVLACVCGVVCVCVCVCVATQKPTT